jgi:hypothetical protein
MCSRNLVSRSSPKQQRVIMSGLLVKPVYCQLLARLKTETDPVSETLCFLFVEIRTMDKVHKLSSNECYTPSSEPFRMYFDVLSNYSFWWIMNGILCLLDPSLWLCLTSPEPATAYTLLQLTAYTFQTLLPVHRKPLHSNSNMNCN